MRSSRTGLAIACGLLTSLGGVATCFGARGGPDSGGYRWIDSAESNYGPLQVFASSPTSLTGLTDDSVQSVPLPWAFPFYGTSYNTIYVSSNGWISFTDPLGNSAPLSASIPASAPPNNLVAFVWSDLLVQGVSSSYGVGSDGSFIIFITATEKASPSTTVIAKVMFYPTGVIKLYWADPGDISNKTIGIENGGGTVGLQVWRNGTGTNGAALTSDYGVAFYPPPLLNCTTPAPTPLNCGQRLTGQTNVGSPLAVNAYGCNAGTFLGPEKTFSFTLTETSNITVAITNSARQLRAFLIGAGCHEALDCVVGGSTTINRPFLTPGTYTIVVDGVTAADAGTFDIELTCVDSAATASCDGAPISGNIAAGAPSILTNWAGCANIPPTGGPGGENIYEITMPASGGHLIADLVSGPPNLHVYIVDPTNFDPAFPDCAESGARHAGLYNLAGNRTYFVVVDDSDPARPGGAYQLEISCAVKMSCGTPIPLDVSNPAPINGSTIGQLNQVENYYCSLATDQGPAEITGYTGGERVYSFTVPPGQVVGFYFLSANPDLKPIILSSCNEGLCVNQINCLEGAPSGDYLLVVDGLNGATGDFTLSPFVVQAAPTMKRWYNCFECNGCPATQLTATSLDRWQFSSNNYCGWGCTYAMYAVVECGRELHLPMDDVETGDVKIFDLLRNRYMDLTGECVSSTLPCPTTGCSWPQTGTEIKWTDSSCRQSPCPNPGASCDGCGGGADACSNEVVVDVSFQGAPAACGVYRMEFLNQGGCVWELFANCDGTPTPNYPIYRDVCSAMNEFRPYPDLVLSNVRIDNSQCGTLTANVIVDVTNQGCLAASSVPVSITDGVTTQNFNMGDILASRVSSRTFAFGPVASTPANLTVTVDPGTPGAIIECREAPNAKACGTTVGQRQISTSACPNTCSTTAEAGPTDLVICEGTDLPVDGSATLANCLTAGPLEYQWKVDGNIVAGCAFRTTPTCNIPGALLIAGLPHIVELEVRCAGAPTQCVSTDVIIVNANADVTPPAAGNTLRGIRNLTNRNDISWSWGSVVDPGLSGYKMWRHVAKIDLPTRANRTVVGTTAQTTTTLNEANAVPNPPALALYQVVGLSCSGLNESPY